MSHPASTPFEARAERQDRFHNPRVNGSCFPDPKRLPSTNAPPTRAGGAYHRTSGIACRRPASGALSLLQMLSPEGARSSTVVTGYSPEVVRDHAPLVDFCNRNEMRAQPPDRPSPAHRAEVALFAAPKCPPACYAARHVGRPPSTYLRMPRSTALAPNCFDGCGTPRYCGWPEPLSKPSQPRFHGPGAVVVNPRMALSAAIAREESFTPTRSARTPPVAALLSPEAWRSLHRRYAHYELSTGPPS